MDGSLGSLLRGGFDFANRLLRPKLLGGVPRQYTFGMMTTSKDRLDEMAKLVGEGKLRPIVDGVYAFEDAIKAYDRQMSGRCVVVSLSRSLVGVMCCVRRGLTDSCHNTVPRARSSSRSLRNPPSLCMLFHCVAIARNPPQVVPSRCEVRRGRAGRGETDYCKRRCGRFTSAKLISADVLEPCGWL